MTIINFTLFRPALLIGFLAAGWRVDALAVSETGSVKFDRWRMPLVQAATPVTATKAAAFAIGFALGRPLVATLAGAVTSLAILVPFVSRPSWHEERAKEAAEC